MSLSNYIQHLALVLRKSIKHQWGKIISAKEISTKEHLQNLKRAKGSYRGICTTRPNSKRGVTMVHIFN